MEKPRTPGQRAGLTRAVVISAACALLAEQGSDALSMRALAQRLGVRPNTLYSHVASKSELIDALLDEVLAEVETPDPDAADPSAGLHALMTSTYEVLLAHPSLVPFYLPRQGARGPQAQRLGEVVLALLARTNVTGERAIEARRALIVFTIGFAAFSDRPALEADPVPLNDAAELAANFSTGLSWLLAGIIGCLGDRPCGSP